MLFQKHLDLDLQRAVDLCTGRWSNPVDAASNVRNNGHPKMEQDQLDESGIFSAHCKSEGNQESPPAMHSDLDTEESPLWDGPHSGDATKVKVKRETSHD